MISKSDLMDDSGIETLKNVFYSVPAPAEMLEAIDISRMSFKEDRLNPVSNLDYYDITRSRSLNLGVYLTDLAYTSTFGRHELSVDYLETVRKLTSGLRIDEAFDESLINQARNNLDNVDSLFEISNEAFVNLIVYCEETGQSNIMVLMTVGAFVESLYLAVNQAEDIPDPVELQQHLADQKYALLNIRALAISLSAEQPYIAELIGDLGPLTEWYEQYGSSPGSTSVNKSESGKLVIGGSPPPPISDAAFTEFSARVRSLRNSIVSNNL